MQPLPLLIATFTTTDTSLGGDRTINSLGARSGQTVNVTVTIPANTSPGDYYIGIFADRTNTVAETDETNNFRALPLTITDNRPDLRVEVVSVNPTLANQGQTVQVRYRISNNGGGNATNFTLRFYLSNNASVTTADTYLFVERTFPSIAAGATLPSTTGVYTINVTIPAAAQSGNRYIGAIIDYDAKVNESNENNNTDSVAVTVRPAPFVDLVIGDLKVDKTTVAPGGQLPFEFQVSNVGNTDVNTLFSTQIYRSTNNIVNVSDTPLGGNTNISAIKGGEILPSTTTYYKVTITIPANTPLGGYFIGPVTDYTARVTESNNNNNGKGLQITVARTPTLDLAANATTITPTRQFVGQSITVNYSVTNKGNTAIASYTIGIYYSTDATISATDRRLIAFTRANIAASATQTGTRTITLPTTLALGPGFIGVFVDQGAAITEVDETNNTSSTGITVVDDKDKDGVPSDVDCDDNDDKVFPAYNGKAAAPEVCDGKDNNCNKTTDENIQPRPCYTGSTGCTQGSSGGYTCVGACKAGTQSCTGGKFGACTGEILPKAETCNGADDNCDGSVDNGITCSEPAPEPPPADGGPRPDAPPLADRRPDIRPTDAGPTDRPVSDRPPTDAKPADVRPSDAGPTDKPPVPDTGDCYSKGCPTGEICRNGMCEADPCASVTCQADEVCKGGTCFKVCGCTQCPAGERCLDGACVTDRCATVRCAAGETCNPDDGMCQEDKCPAITCGPGRVCQLSACVDDPCLNLNCPSGTKCENGQCIGEQCGGENPGEGVSGENTTGENPASSENANTEPVVGDQASTDAAPGDLSASEPGGNEQISIGEPATPDSSSTDVVSGNDNNPGTDGAPPVGGGCCETGRASSQAPLMIFLFSLFFIGWVRRK